MENAGKLIDYLKCLIDNGKVVAANASGQLRVDMQLLTKVVQDTCEVIVDLRSTMGCDDGSGKEKLVGITTNISVVVEELVKESQRASLIPEIANTAESIFSATKKLSTSNLFSLPTGILTRYYLDVIAENSIGSEQEINSIVPEIAHLAAALATQLPAEPPKSTYIQQFFLNISVGFTV